jgi:AhpD family alkylhydroperoxidase
MRTQSIVTVTAIMAVLFAPPSRSRANPGEAQTTYQDIQKTLGLVPGFLKAFPESGIAAAWDELKAVQLNPNTALPGKTKELIGLAVASQIPCQYCIVYHTELAKLTGASDPEIREAVAMAASTRHWSTIVNGNMIDETAFRRDVDQVVTNAKKAAKH